MKVIVTASDIKSPEYGGHSCPVARALIRSGFPDAYAGVLDLYLDGTGGFRVVPTPLAVETFIRAFDAGFPVEPFSFELEVPE